MPEVLRSNKLNYAYWKLLTNDHPPNVSFKRNFVQKWVITCFRGNVNRALTKNESVDFFSFLHAGFLHVLSTQLSDPFYPRVSIKHKQSEKDMYRHFCISKFSNSQ